MALLYIGYLRSCSELRMRNQILHKYVDVHRQQHIAVCYFDACVNQCYIL
jgi:hypothetical protein